MPAVLYGCETWSLTLKEEHRLRIFKNTALTKILQSKREEVSEELHNAYYSPGDQITDDEMETACCAYGTRHMHTGVGYEA
jgi:hypothetical protein